MAIQSIQGVTPFLKTERAETKPEATPYEAQHNFAHFLKESLNQVSQAEAQSNNLTNKLIRGEDVDLHQVLIAGQKASIAMQLTMEVRNKAVEAYQEVMRMQM
ncbi:flagellar hook-basal body complex protein FliE [Pseudobacillus wudalianchiensis]|uniref:Flagellar hook-basal body complex protein FliE n=1 Tax=Pseudobacillus wudalianchiensis TaxID=1743143 RepID=A0A1B9AJ27_9BACI|nr:flagellar hook-basal body complex protein FliE [Bacillus wudalianchiensis]OCA83840.1 flagellar hook-basal body complex protein FliE [Bacillus wudalianchiensis]